MPGRKTPLVNGEIYHVFNRGINRQPTFLNRWNYRRATTTIRYYHYAKPPMKLSILFKQPSLNQKEIFTTLEKHGEKLTEILSFCLMPNHYHFLLRQNKEEGISKFIANFQNSYTRYFNVNQKRDGPLFLDQFKAVRIETDNQLLHVHRYIHLNPYTSFVVNSKEALVNYSWSSLKEYLDNQHIGLCDKRIILHHFSSRKKYKYFILNQADYQRKLGSIKHLILE